MTIRGDRTGDDRIYQDALTEDAALSTFAGKVQVIGDDTLTDMQAQGSLTLKDGTTLSISHDLAVRLPQALLAGKLRTKAEAMIGAREPRCGPCSATSRAEAPATLARRCARWAEYLEHAAF